MKLIQCQLCGKERYVHRWGKWCGNACRQKAKRERARHPLRYMEMKVTYNVGWAEMKDGSSHFWEGGEEA